MKYNKNMDEPSKGNRGTLIFDSGKKIFLDDGECKEFDARLLLAKAVGQLCRETATDGMKFTCPDCGTHRLECIEDGPYNSEVLNIDEDGDFDYGEINANGMVERFQCLHCGYILVDSDDINLTFNEDVIEWIKKNVKI